MRLSLEQQREVYVLALSTKLPLQNHPNR
jgi:hypothetical protein